ATGNGRRASISWETTRKTRGNFSTGFRHSNGQHYRKWYSLRGRGRSSKDRQSRGRSLQRLARRLTNPPPRISSKNCNAQSGICACLLRSKRIGTPERRSGLSGISFASSSPHQAPVNRSTDSCLRKAKPDELPVVSQQNRANQNSPIFLHP